MGSRVLRASQQHARLFDERRGFHEEHCWDGGALLPSTRSDGAERWGTMTCHISENVIVCNGQNGWRVEPFAYCPWCMERRRCLTTLIFSGWCGSDYICGTCGSRWSDDGGIWMPKISEEAREENIARVAAMPDPKCWDCHDTGDISHPAIDMEPKPCQCEAAKRIPLPEE